jgi:hypothetical protein
MQSRRYTVTVQGRLGERFRATVPGVSIEPQPGHTPASSPTRSTRGSFTDC